MSSNENLRGAQKREEITRTMRICDENVAPESSENGKIPTITQNPSQQGFRASPYSAYRSDPLAADAPGDELLPEAAVWTIYKKEATEYDNELVKGRDENLNTMLLFAALFSAILTAFLIESTSLLQEDHAETSAALLLLLVQSDLGATNSSSTLPGSVSFTPESSARWVNGLWFAAFSLSLAATLLAMLAKEWLDAFTTSHKRAPHAYAISRQARLDGFEAWGAPHIMDLLPTLLHLSLLLFALGLVVYLWRLDQAIAIMLSFIISLTCLLYLGTVVCGAVYQYCPFITRLSRYLQLIIQTTLHVIGKDCDEEHLRQDNPSPNGELTAADIRALAWLAGHARDQESGDSAYQALAGLSKRKAQRLVPARKTKQERQKLLVEAREVAHFLRDYAARFRSTLTESPQELAKCRGENIIRYAKALPGIVNCVDTFLGDLDPVLDQQGCNHSSIQLEHPVDRVMDLILKVVDKIWSGQCELSASTYAAVAASELRYIVAMVKNEMPDNSSESSALSQRPATSNASRVIGINKRRDISAAQLWARYYATLGCAAYLIDLHLESDRRDYSMKPRALLDLLEGIATTTAFMLRQSTLYSRSSCDNNIRYTTLVDLNSDNSRGSGLADAGSCLIQLLEKLLALSSDLDLPLDVQDAFAWAMYTISVLNGQDAVWSNDLFFWGLDSLQGQRAVAKAVANLAFSLAASNPSSWLLGKALSSLLRVIKNMDSSSSGEIPGILRHELVSMIQLGKKSMSSWSEDARGSLSRVLVVELPDHSITPHKTKTVLAEVFNDRVRSHYSDSDFQTSVSWLLSIMQQTPNCLSEVKTLLSELIELLNEFDGIITGGSYGSGLAVDNPYLNFFTETPGFYKLAQVGQHADYIPPVAQTIIRLCINSHFQQVRAKNIREILMAKFQRVQMYDTLYYNEGRQLFREYRASPLVPHPPTISPLALPGFLDALTLALDYIQSGQLEEPTEVPGFAECAMKLLNVSLIASCGEINSDCGIKAGEVARRLCENGAPRLEIEAAGVIAQYGQYCELPMQTDKEIAILEDLGISRTNDELNSLQAPTPE